MRHRRILLRAKQEIGPQTAGGVVEQGLIEIAS